jgi:hypothetical protein
MRASDEDGASVVEAPVEWQNGQQMVKIETGSERINAQKGRSKLDQKLTPA